MLSREHIKEIRDKLIQINKSLFTNNPDTTNERKIISEIIRELAIANSTVNKPTEKQKRLFDKPIGKYTTDNVLKSYYIYNEKEELIYTRGTSESSGHVLGVTGTTVRNYLDKVDEQGKRVLLKCTRIGFTGSHYITSKPIIKEENEKNRK